ncbi:MAG: carboxypeptidase-like regulatory domain-containing protein [Planctomycetes bacterium]|nr:carboxypeptidase-like regulatory domain-containing protein [Planctomycetota bacterium]
MARTMFRAMASVWVLSLCCVALLLFPAAARGQSWVLSGSVLDPDGNGVAGVDIDITSSGGVDLSLSGDFTDATGAFALTVVDVVLPGFYTIDLNPPAGAGYFPGSVADVFLAGSTDLGAFELEFGAIVTGRVIDESGAGIEGIDLEITDADGNDFAANNDDTDALGFYSVQIPHGTWDIEFRQVLPGTVSYVSEIVESLVVTGNAALADVTMVAGYPLAGHVQDESSAPLAGADVDIEDAATGAKIHTTNDNTDALGDFEVIVPPGDLTVIVRPPTGELLVPAVVPYTVNVPPPANDIGTIVLAAGVAVTATVTSVALAPVADVDADFVVSANQAMVATVGDNTSALGELAVIVPPDTYDIQLRPPFATGLAPVVLADIAALVDTDLGTVILPAGNSLSGTVTDAGDPVAGVLVTLSDAASGDPVYVFGNATNALGAYALRVVDGNYDVLFTPPPTSGLAAVEILGVDVLSNTSLDANLAGGGGPTEFVRGNADGVGSVGLSDVIVILMGLFANGPLPACRDIIDANDDGQTDISDPLWVLVFLFAQGPAIPAPYPDPGVDPSDDALPCP